MVLFAGRRWGKTCTLAAIIIQTMLAKPFGLSHYVSPSYARGREFFRLLLAVAFPIIKHTTLQPVPTITWINGSRTQIRSFDSPNLLRGDASDLICLDESCYCSEEDCNSVLRPMLADRRGRLVLSSTPVGHDWCWSLYEQDGKNGIRGFRFPTSSGPQFQSIAGKNELESIRTSIPKIVWEQEFECLPVASQNSVFCPADLKIAAVNVSAPSSAIDGRKYILAVDIGKNRDRGAIVIVDDLCMVVHAEAFPLGTPYEIQAQKAAILSQKFGNCRCCIDITGGGEGGVKSNFLYGRDPAVEIYRKAIPNLQEIIWNSINKEKFVQGLAVDLEQHKLKIPAQFRELLSELSTYEYQLRLSRYFYAGKTGCRDDLVAGLLMANIGRRNNWFAHQDTGKPIRF